MAHEKAIADAFDGLWGKSLERNWILGRLGLPEGGGVFNVPDKPGYKYVNKGAEGEQGRVIARDRVGVADVLNQRVRMRYEFGEYVIRDAEYLDSSGGLSNTLAGLTDVALTSLADGNTIEWDSSLGKWVNVVPGSGGGTTYTGGAAIDINGSNVISVKVNSSSAIVVDGGSNTLLVNAGDGIKITLNALTLNLAANPGLEYGTGGDAGKVRVKVDADGGIQRMSTGIGIKLPTPSGLFVDSTGLVVDNSLAGNGLNIIGKVMFVKVPTPSGITVDATGIYLGSAIAGLGLTLTAQVLDVGAGDGIDSLTNTIAVDVTDIIDTAAGLKEDASNNIQVRLETNSGLQFGGAGGVQLGTPTTLTVATVTNTVTSTTHQHAITTSSDVGTSPVAAILASNSSGQLVLAQLTLKGNLIFAGGDRSITASNSLTIAPSTDLILDPTGLILTPNAQDIRAITINDLPTGIDGYRIWNRYANYTQLTIGAIKADELYVRVFTADETRIDRGEEYWSKSFGIIQTDFTLPAVNSTVDVWFEDAPAAVTFNLFALNDYLLLRTIDWGTGLVVQKVWFQVTAAKLAQETTAINGVDRQQWRIKRLQGGINGSLIKRGNLALDVGQVGQGWIHLSALSQDGGPFIQIGTMTSVATVPQFTNYVRMGNLNGTVDYATNVYGFAAGSGSGGLGTTPSGGFSGMTAEATNGLRLFNTAIAMYDAGVKMIRFDKDTGLTLDIDITEGATFGRYIRWQDNVDSLDVESNVRFGAWKVGAANKMGLLVVSPDVATNSYFALQLERSSDAAATTLDLDLTQLHLRFDLNNGEFYFSNNGRFLVTHGTGATVAASPIHIYENNAVTDASGGITIEQDSTGDALLQFLLSATRRWVVGIDNSDGDKFKISNNAALGAGDVLSISTAGLVDIISTIRSTDFATPSTGVGLEMFYIPASTRSQISSYDRTASAYKDFRIDGLTLALNSNSGGFVGINNTDPIGELEVFSSDATNLNRGITNTQINTGAQGGLFNFMKARGTRASKTTVTNGDFIGVFFFDAYDGSNYLHTAGIAAKVNGTVATGSAPTDLIFATGAANNVSLTNEVMRIASSGKVGIGQAAPASPLHLYENTSATTTAAGMTIEQAGTGDAKLQFLLTGGQRWGIGIDNSDGDKFEIASGTDLGTTPALTILPSGLVGINSVSPETQLDVQSDANTVIRATNYGLDRFHFLGRRANGTQASPTSVTSGLVLLRIGVQCYTSGGWATNGSGRIDIVSTEDFNSGVSGKGGAEMQLWTRANGAAAATQRMTIGNDGYVGINSTAPDARLDVDTDDNNGIRSTVYGTTNWFNYVARRALGSQASPTAVALDTIIGSWGAVGYASSGWNPAAAAPAQMQFRASQPYTSTGRGSKIQFYTTLTNTTTISKVMELENDGAMTVPYIANNAANATVVHVNLSTGLLTHATSSIRYKTNVREMEGFGDDFVMALRPIVYNNKYGDDANDYVGFVAEDVFGIGGKPFVSFNDAGQVESLHYDKLTVPLVAAVQDLIPYKARIAQLEAEMVELRARVSAMEGE